MTAQLAARIRSSIDEQSGVVGPVTIERFAAVVRVSRKAMSAVLAGRATPSVSLLRRIAIATGRSVDWLLGLGECPECGWTDDEIEARTHCAREIDAKASK